MTLNDFLNKYDEVFIKRCGSLGTTGYTVTSSNNLMATVGHMPTAQENIELALDTLASYIETKKAEVQAAELAWKKSRVRRVIKF